METNPQLELAFNFLEYTGTSIFLTGKAGTGKTTFLRELKRRSPKRMIVVAPTGVAAINAGGVTIHSFFQLPFGPYVPGRTEENRSGEKRFNHKFGREKINIIRSMDLLVIDEISMVRAYIIDFMDNVLRVYCRNMREPFGGKQLLLVGDIFQLEPVVKEDDRRLLNPFYRSSFFFDAKVFEYFKLVSIELKKVYRQSDPVFISILDHIRTSQVPMQDFQRLNQRVGARLDEGDSKLAITLSTRRDTVDYINDSQLQRLPGEPCLFRGHIQG
ncbi:MAG: AAA family ATPase, partial [Odoribacter splanchnicus]